MMHADGRFVILLACLVAVTSCRGGADGDPSQSSTATTVSAGSSITSHRTTPPLPPTTLPSTSSTTMLEVEPVLLVSSERGIELVDSRGAGLQLLTDDPTSVGLADGHGGVVFQEQVKPRPLSIDWLAAAGEQPERVVDRPDARAVILEDAFDLDGDPAVLYTLVGELPNDCSVEDEECRWSFIRHELILLNLATGAERVLGYTGSFESDYLTFRMDGDTVAAQFEAYGSGAGCVALTTADYLLDQPGEEWIRHPEPCTLGPAEGCEDGQCFGGLAMAVSSDGRYAAIAFDRTVSPADGSPPVVHPPVLATIDTTTADEIRRMTIGTVGQHPSSADFDGVWAVVTLVDDTSQVATVLVGPDETVTAVHTEGFVQLWQGPIPTTSQPAVGLSTDWKVTLWGIGPVRAGMTIAETELVAGTRLLFNGPDSALGDPSACHFVVPADGPEGIDFMVVDGIVERIDIRSTEFETLSGARVGDTEADILALYPGQIEVLGHEYLEGGHYLVFMPHDAEDAEYRLLFETDGSVVTEFRSGRIAAVFSPEGCS